MVNNYQEVTIVFEAGLLLACRGNTVSRFLPLWLQKFPDYFSLLSQIRSINFNFYLRQFYRS